MGPVLTLSRRVFRYLDFASALKAVLILNSEAQGSISGSLESKQPSGFALREKVFLFDYAPQNLH